MALLEKSTGGDTARFPSLLSLLAVALLVGLSSWAGLEFTAGEQLIAAIWPANGLLLAFLMTSASRQWPTYFVLGFCANLAAIQVHGDPLPLGVGLAFCNFLEVFIAATAFGRYTRMNPDLTQRRVLTQFGTFAVLIGPALSSVLAAGWLSLLAPFSFTKVLEIRFIADAVGMAIVAPLALSFRRYDYKRLLNRKTASDTVFLLLAMGAVTAAMFSQASYPFMFMLFPPLVYIVFRLGFPGLTCAIFIVAIVSIGYTVRGHGPFMLVRDVTAYERLQMLQNFILATVLATVPLAVILAERDTLRSQLAKVKNQLKHLVSTDSLTGLADNHTFGEVLQASWADAIKANALLSLVTAEIDFFPAYVERYGASSGNACLRAVATAIQESALRVLDLPARIGETQFVIMAPETNAPGAMAIAIRLQQKVQKLHIEHGASAFGQITLSISVATAKPGVESSESLLVSARRTLNEARKNCDRIVQAAAD